MNNQNGYYHNQQNNMVPQGQQYPAQQQPIVLQPGNGVAQNAAVATPKKSSGNKMWLGILLGFLACAILGAAAMAVYLNWDGGKDDNVIMPSASNNQTSAEAEDVEDVIGNSAASPVTDTTVPDSGEYTRLTYAQVAQKVKPSVCTVISYVDGIDYGGGSGIITSADGYIITNAHVIYDENYPNMTASVKTYDGVEYDAQIIGYDVKSDIALLKIDATGLIPAEIGDSTVLVEGDEVVAIGTPLDEAYAGTVTNGIISGVDRVLDDGETAVKYLQTNAAINPGNSGGALCNMYGQVIGVNTAKIVAEGYEGIGFAIPMDSIIDIIAELKAYGYVTRPALGITCSAISKSMAETYNVPRGVQIISIAKESGLYGKAEVYDIITAVDGVEVNETIDLQLLVQEKKPGDTVELTIYRSRTTSQAAQTFTITVELVKDTDITSYETENSSNNNNGGYDNYGGGYDNYDSYDDYYGGYDSYDWFYDYFFGN